MIIKELEISGFKSFALRTAVKFEHPIVGIVGPNGCGKSNILDAIKWVLGEKSVKSIRGEKMEDVIFSGNESRKPANFAQVNVTFDNTGQIFALETDTVQIGRRLYRDGQSQYFINGARVTRREIEELLMDTGLGKSSYSYMEQGRMDMILSSRPEERRYIFEEAAGISRFKAQKEEAVRNLENTEVNLTRLKDIIHELERELKIKREQAEKTEKYNTLREKFREHDLKIRFMSLNEIEENMLQFQDKLSRRLAEKEKIQQKLIQFREKLTQLDDDERVMREELHMKDVANQVSRERIAQLEKSAQEKEERKKTISAQLDTLREQTTRLEKRIKELKRELDGQNQFTLQLDIRLTDAEKALSEIEITFDEIQKNKLVTERKIEEARLTQIKNHEMQKKLRDELEVVIKDLLTSLKKEKSVWEKSEKEKFSMREKIKKQLNQLQTLLEELPAKKSNITEADIKKILQSQDFETLGNRIDNLAELSPSLRHLLFEKGGIHSQKEELDEALSDIERSNTRLEQEIYNSGETLKSLAEEHALKIKEKEIILGDIKSFNLQKANLKEKEKDLDEQIKYEETNLSFQRGQYRSQEMNLLQAVQEQKTIFSEIDALKTGINKELTRIETLEKNLEKLGQRRSEFNQVMKKENEKTEEVFQATNELEVKIGTLLGNKDALTQSIYNDYNLTAGEMRERFKHSRIQLINEKSNLADVQKAISALGPINPLAIQELSTIQELYDHNESQLNDINKARADIQKVLNEIQNKSEILFRESFAQIEMNFRDVFRKLFKGGEASLTLQEPEKPLESGIDIQAQPPGKRTKSLRALSGGERTLTAIALMFGIYLVKSSPFCVMDEIDAPLDEHNVARFLTLLDEFAANSQFILITHNKKTMSKAHALYGVTMEEPGISRLLGVELKSAVV